MTDAASPDLFLMGLAALNLIGHAASEAPVLLVAEDAQWLDQSSGDVLAFVARRPESEPIVMLAAIRTVSRALWAWPGFPSSASSMHRRSEPSVARRRGRVTGPLTGAGRAGVDP